MKKISRVLFPIFAVSVTACQYTVVPVETERDPIDQSEKYNLPSSIAIDFYDNNPLNCEFKKSESLKWKNFSAEGRIARIEYFALTAVCSEIARNHSLGEKSALNAVLLSDLADYKGEWYILSLFILADRSHHDDRLLRSWAAKRLSLLDRTALNYPWVSDLDKRIAGNSARSEMSEINFSVEFFGQGKIKKKDDE